MNDFYRDCSSCTDARQRLYQLQMVPRRHDFQIVAEPQNMKDRKAEPLPIAIATIAIACPVCHSTGKVLTDEGALFMRLLMKQPEFMSGIGCTTPQEEVAF